MDSLENLRFRHSEEKIGGELLNGIFKREAKVLGEQQEAELMLFQYVIGAACRADIHLDIPLSLASYISNINDLPSSCILEAASPINAVENDTKISSEQVIQLSETLAELAPDVRRMMSEDIVDDGKPWITVQPYNTGARLSKKEREDELWRHMETVPASYAEYKGKDPKAKESRPVFYRVARILIIALCFFVGMRIMGYSPHRFIIESTVVRELIIKITSSFKNIMGNSENYSIEYQGNTPLNVDGKITPDNESSLLGNTTNSHILSGNPEELSNAPVVKKAIQNATFNNRNE